MSQTSGGSLVAADIYRRWKRLVKGATESVRIFTPYLDRLAVDLLSNTRLPPASLSVVTDLSPETGAQDWRDQLLTIRRLLNAKIEVRSLARLHAKVLVIDARTVTVGSQNFTRFGRGSKETTAVPDAAVSTDGFLGVLDGWFDESIPVDLALVERLLEALDDATMEAQRAITALVDGYEETRSAYEQEKEAERRRRIEVARQRAARLGRGSGIRTAAHNAKYRNAKATAWAQVDWNPGWTFRTLMAQSDTDLTRWRRVEDGGPVETIRLQRLGFYPLLLGPAERFGFANVTMSRISYVLTSFHRGGTVRVGSDALHVTVDCPKPQADGTNLVLMFCRYQHSESGYRVRFRFDGTTVRPTAPGAIVGHPWNPDRLASAIDDAISDPDEWTSVLSALFRHLPGARGYRNDPNASSFFPEGWIRLDLSSFAGQPILLARAQSDT